MIKGANVNWPFLIFLGMKVKSIVIPKDKIATIPRDEKGNMMMGVRILENKLLFNASMPDEQILNLAQKCFSECEGRNPGVVKKRFKPTKRDESRVQKIVSGDIDVSKFGIYTAVASNTLIDPSRDQFTKGVLEKMAEHYREGRTVVIESHEGYMGIGRTFDAEVVPMSKMPGHHEIEVKFYVDNEMQTSNGSAKRAVDTVYNRVSISAYMGRADFIEKSPEDDLPVFLYSNPENVITRHLAVVDFGMNVGAKIKSAKTSIRVEDNFGITVEKHSKDIPMDLKPIKSKYLNKSFQMNDEAATAFEELEKKHTDVLAELEEFKVAEKKKTLDLKQSFLNKKAQINPNATEEDKKEWQEYADVFASSSNVLEKEIAKLDKELKKIKENSTLDTSGAAEKVEKQNQKPADKKKKKKQLWGNR